MRHLAFVSCALLALLPAVAHAGNDDELLAGNQAAMMGGAVSAFVRDSSAIWYDPAGLGGIERDQVDVSGTVYTLRFYRVPGFIVSTSGASDDANVAEFVSIPTQIAYVRALAPGLVLGLGYFVPQATNLVLREQLRVDDDSGQSAWQVAIAQASTLHNAAAALGFALAPGVRFGVGLIGSYQAQSQSASVFSVVGPTDSTMAVFSTAAIGTASRVGMELTAGLQLDLSQRFELGIAVRSPRLQLIRSSNAVVSMGESVAGNDDVPALISGAIDQPDESSPKLTLLRAGRYGVSLAYEYARDSKVCLEGDIQPPLRVDSQNVRRKTVINARLGVYHALGSGLALGAGLFTDRSPDVLPASPGEGAGDFYGATIGIALRSEHWLAKQERTPSLVFSSVFALRYAFSRGDMNRFVADPEAPESLLTMTKHGHLIAHELGLYVGSGLEF